MKWGFRRPSLRRRLAARTSWKRYVRHSLGLKAPRGWGWFTNPKRALYNRVYYRTTFGLNDLLRPRRRRRRASSGCLIILIALAAGGLTLSARLLAGSASDGGPIGKMLAPRHIGPPSLPLPAITLQR